MTILPFPCNRFGSLQNAIMHRKFFVISDERWSRNKRCESIRFCEQTMSQTFSSHWTVCVAVSQMFNSHWTGILCPAVTASDCNACASGSLATHIVHAVRWLFYENYYLTSQCIHMKTTFHTSQLSDISSLLDRNETEVKIHQIFHFSWRMIHAQIISTRSQRQNEWQVNCNDNDADDDDVILTKYPNRHLKAL